MQKIPVSSALMETRSTLDSLLDEMWFEILLRLIPEDIVSFSRLSKKAHELTSNPMLWADKLKNDYGVLNTRNPYQLFAKKYKRGYQYKSKLTRRLYSIVKEDRLSEYLTFPARSGSWNMWSIDFHLRYDTDGHGRSPIDWAYKNKSQKILNEIYTTAHQHFNSLKERFMTRCYEITLKTCLRLDLLTHTYESHSFQSLIYWAFLCDRSDGEILALTHSMARLYDKYFIDDRELFIPIDLAAKYGRNGLIKAWHAVDNELVRHPYQAVGFETTKPPLYHAIKAKRVETALFLIQLGATLDQRMLEKAIDLDLIAIVQAHIASGNHLTTIFQMVINKTNATMAIALIDIYRDKLKVDEWSEINKLAIKKDLCSVVKKLVGLQSLTTKTQFELALEHDADKVATSLLEDGIAIENPKQLLVNVVLKRMRSATAWLLEHHSGLIYLEREGNNLLDLALLDPPDMELAKRLVAQGIMPNKGSERLVDAIKWGNAEVMYFLLKYLQDLGSVKLANRSIFIGSDRVSMMVALLKYIEDRHISSEHYVSQFKLFGKTILCFGQEARIEKSAALKLKTCILDDMNTTSIDIHTRNVIRGDRDLNWIFKWWQAYKKEQVAWTENQLQATIVNNRI